MSLSRFSLKNKYGDPLSILLYFSFYPCSFCRQIATIGHMGPGWRKHWFPEGLVRKTLIYSTRIIILVTLSGHRLITEFGSCVPYS